MALSAHQGLRDVEASLIGNILVKGDLFEEVSERLDAGDFSTSLMANTWRAFNALTARQEPIDLATVTLYMDTVGTSYDLHLLADLARNSGTPDSVGTYATIIAAHSEKRHLLSLLARHQARAEHASPTDVSPHDLAAEIEADLGRFTDDVTAPADTASTIDRLLDNALATARGEKPPQATVSLGLPRIDACTGGGRSKDLTVLAGRPSHGKTSYALRVAVIAAVLSDRPRPCVIFSLEMSLEKLLNRLVAMLSGLPLKVVASPTEDVRAKHNLTLDQVTQAMTKAAKTLKAAPLQIEECANLRARRASGILKSAKRWTSHYGNLGLVVVDYLQLIEPEAEMVNAPTESVIANSSRAMKAMAKQLDTHVMALSQLNRKLEDRPDKRPVLADLRGSGSIEQDADVVAFVYQDQLYHPDTLTPNIMDVIVGKNRDGSLVETRAELDLACSRILALSEQEETAIESKLKQKRQRKTSAAQKANKPPL